MQWSNKRRVSILFENISCLCGKIPPSHVDDNTFEGMGSPMDKDENWIETGRNTTIIQKSRQDCEILIHEHQIQMRVDITPWCS